MGNKNLTFDGADAAPEEGMLVVESFLNENYLFRFNVLNGKVEFVTKSAVDDLPADDDSRWRPLTERALNSIILRAKREDVCEGTNPKSDIQMLVQSEEVRAYDPIRAYLDQLPQWDGQNHVARLFSRLPGIGSEHLGFLSVWLRSAVAHWLQMDTLHGNECVPTLIGKQGCGKTTFFKRLLPPHLRQYYLDHLNLSNKFDKEMALTNNLLVNIDELATIRPSQHASLKQTLSKSKVNGRPATTNDPHPLTDVTGNRRYICLTIPDGQFIDNSGEIDYDQLYAQVLYEIREMHSPYWFNNAEVARLQELNMEYVGQKDIDEIADICFRKPEESENVKSMSCGQLITIIRRSYPSVADNHATKISLGRAMNRLGFEQKMHSNVAFYKAVPRERV